jgi:hypothetical protein
MAGIRSSPARSAAVSTLAATAGSRRGPRSRSPAGGRRARGCCRRARRWRHLGVLAQLMQVRPDAGEGISAGAATDPARCGMRAAMPRPSPVWCSGARSCVGIRQRRANVEDSRPSLARSSAARARYASAPFSRRCRGRSAGRSSAIRTSTLRGMTCRASPVEMAPHLGAHLCRQVRAGVVHREDDPAARSG